MSGTGWSAAFGDTGRRASFFVRHANGKISVLMHGYVYLIGSRRFSWYKIGQSTNAEIRIKDIGILLPFKVVVFAVWKAESYKYLERTLHGRYSNNRLNGEWFYFSDEELQQLILSVPYMFVQNSNFTSFQNVIEDRYRLRPPKRIKKIRCQSPEREFLKEEQRAQWTLVLQIKDPIARKAAKKKLKAEGKLKWKSLQDRTMESSISKNP